MGGGASLPGTEDLLDMENSKHFKSLPDSAKAYAQNMGDSYLGFFGLVESVAQKLDKDAYSTMTPEEREEFNSLEARKLKVVQDVKIFVKTEGERFRIVGSRISQGKTVKELLLGIDPTRHVAKVEKLQCKILKLQVDYENFGKLLDQHCREDGRNANSFTNIVKAITGFALSLGFIAAIIVHFTPATLVLAPIEIVFLGVGAIFLTSCSIYALRSDEISRAREYIKNINAKLTNLREAMEDLQASSDRLDDKQSVKDFQELCKLLENRCFDVAKACDVCMRKQFS